MEGVVHILYVALPEISGSTVRSHSMMLSQKRYLKDIQIYVAPTSKGTKGSYEKDGINYHYLSGTFNPSSESQKSILIQCIKALGFLVWYVKLIIRLCKGIDDVSIVHCHSMFITVLPILLLQKIYPHIRVIYEIRSFWELRITNRLKFRLARGMENFVAKYVDNIVVISSAMKVDLVARGLSPERITINRNFIEIKEVPKKIPEKILNFAYVGNVSNIEGIEHLIEAFEELALVNAKLTIYGQGSFLKELSSKFHERYFYGGFEKGDVLSIYENIDAVVINRRGLEICHKVTPLKPLEAVNFNKLLLASNVGGIVEIMNGNESNYISYNYDCKNSLKQALLYAYNMSTKEIEDKILASRIWLTEHRSEGSYIKDFIRLYE